MMNQVSFIRYLVEGGVLTASLLFVAAQLMLLRVARRRSAGNSMFSRSPAAMLALLSLLGFPLAWGALLAAWTVSGNLLYLSPVLIALSLLGLIWSVALKIVPRNPRLSTKT